MKTNRVLWAINTSSFVFNTAFLAFALLVPMDALHKGYAVWMVGLVTAVPGILQLPTRIISGPVTDWAGERTVLLGTYALALMGGLAVVVLSSSIVGLVVGQLCIGAARGLFWTAAQSLVSRQPGDPAKLLGQFTSIAKGGSLVGVAGAGAMAQGLGLTSAFLVTAGLSLLAIVIGLAFPSGRPLNRAPHIKAAMRGLWGASYRPLVVIYGLVAFLCAVPQALGQSFYPVDLIHLGLSPTWASGITALLSFGMIFAGFMASFLVRRWGMRQLFLYCNVALAVSLAMTAWPAVATAAVAIFMAGVAAGGLNVVFLTSLVQQSPQSLRGTNLGMAQAYYVVAMISIPVVSGWLVTRSGYSATFILEGAGILAATVLVLWMWNWPHRRESRLDQSSAGVSVQ